MPTATYTVEGMTCGACIAEVIERVRLLPDVTGVAVGFVNDDASPLFIESRAALAPEAVRETVEKAGFHASSASRHLAQHLQRTFAGSMPQAQPAGRRVKAAAAIR